MTPRVTAFGESALFVELGDVFDESLAAWARALADQWPLGPAVPAYASVMASFDPEATEPEIAERQMRDPVGTKAVDPRRVVDLAYLDEERNCRRNQRASQRRSVWRHRAHQPEHHRRPECVTKWVANIEWERAPPEVNGESDRRRQCSEHE